MRCPSCRYDRAGLPADALCPECGAAPPVVGDARDRVLDVATSRATIALGLATLAWIGLVGFGVLGVVLGGAALVVASGARRAARETGEPHPAASAMAVGASVLGLGAAAVGVCLMVWVLMLLG